MTSKALSGIMLSLLLISLFSLTFNIQPVKASGTIYIRADGSVEPETAPILSVDNVAYTFTDNIFDEIVVERNNIVVDGSGYTLQGHGIGCGFYLDSTNNVTIKRTLIKTFSRGIVLNASSFNVVSQNNITDNWDGVNLYSSSSNTISRNNVTNNGWGVTLHSSSNNTIIANNITKHLYASERTPVGVQLFLSSNNTISANNITNNYSGVHLDESSFNIICGDNITNNPYNGLYLSESLNNTIYRNSITNNGYSVYFHSSSLNVVSENNITDNEDGVALRWSSTNNVVSGNTITNNSYGFACSGGIVSYENGTRFYYLSSNNTASRNNVTNNHLGVELYLSSSNIIYHNNFINNAEQVYDYSWDHPEFPPSINSWDDGYPSGGNYWSDHVCTGNPSDGSLPYIIDENNIDHYPFQDPDGWSLYTQNGEVMFSGVATANEEWGEFVCYGSYYCNVTIEEILYDPNNTLSLGDFVTVCYNQSLSLEIGDQVECYGYYWKSIGPLQCVGSVECIRNDYYVIPESPSLIILPLTMIATLLAAMFYKKRRLKV